MERTQFAAVILSSEPSIDAKAPEGAAHLAPLAGKSLHQWVVDAALGASIRRIAVVADLAPRTKQELEERVDDAMIEIVAPLAESDETLAVAIDSLGNDFSLREHAHVLLLQVECPQITSADLRRVIERHIVSGAAATVYAGAQNAGHTEPVVIRDEFGRISSISDIPVGGGAVFCFRADLVVPALRRSNATVNFQSIGVEAAQALTEAGHEVQSFEYPGQLEVIRAATSRTSIEGALRRRVVEQWIERGVVIPDPRQVAIDATVQLSPGVTIKPGTVIEGRTLVADGAELGPNTHLVDAVVGSSAVVPHSVIWSSEVKAREQLAPFTVRQS